MVPLEVKTFNGVNTNGGGYSIVIEKMNSDFTSSASLPGHTVVTSTILSSLWLAPTLTNPISYTIDPSCPVGDTSWSTNTLVPSEDFYVYQGSPYTDSRRRWELSQFRT